MIDQGQGADRLKLMPHKQPEGCISTVTSAFSSVSAKAYPPGGVSVLPGNTPHHHWPKSGEYVMQIAAIGPLGLEYLDPADDPRKQGGQSGPDSNRRRRTPIQDE